MISENLYNSKVLISNWFEDRSDPKNPHNTVFAERKDDVEKYKPIYTQTKFVETRSEYLKFDDNAYFNTNYRAEFKKPEEQVRSSEIDPFFLKKDVFQKDPSKLEEYREKYTKAPHVWSRTYLGAPQTSSVRKEL